MNWRHGCVEEFNPPPAINTAFTARAKGSGPDQRGDPFQNRILLRGLSPDPARRSGLPSPEPPERQDQNPCLCLSPLVSVDPSRSQDVRGSCGFEAVVKVLWLLLFTYDFCRPQRPGARQKEAGVGHTEDDADGGGANGHKTSCWSRSHTRGHALSRPLIGAHF
jgi:hypothetical protein